MHQSFFLGLNFFYGGLRADGQEWEKAEESRNKQIFALTTALLKSVGANMPFQKNGEQKRIKFDNRTQMNADNQDFKYTV